jgi:hypothetical protein
MKQSARVFQRKGIVFVRNESLVKDMQRVARQLVAPQLMGGTVRQHAEDPEWLC